jgi:AraC-like DNA-binding protein
VSVLHAGDNVLPAICAQHAGVEGSLLLRAENPADNRLEVFRVRGGLLLKNAVYSFEQRDEVIDSAIALGGVQAHMLSGPFQLIELHMLGLSRSVFAERFNSMVGQPPMQYLALWRMHMAAQRLREGHGSVAQIGFEIGYGAEAAFSRAFKRRFGTSPAAWRKRSV